jgi:hypothetical protein
MERGLLWLPLLALFIWLAWAGWNEYQKVEAYRRWSSDFERHKYDIYAMLGQAGDRLVWCKPTLQKPTELGSILFGEIRQVRLNINGQLVLEPTNLPESTKNPRTVAIELLTNSQTVQSIPFTDVAIALNWFRYLSEQVQLSQHH